MKCTKCGIHVHEKKCKETFMENEAKEKEAEKKRAEEEARRKAAAAKAKETPKKAAAGGNAADDVANLTDAEIDAQFELIAVNKNHHTPLKSLTFHFNLLTH